MDASQNDVVRHGNLPLHVNTPLGSICTWKYYFDKLGKSESLALTSLHKFGQFSQMIRYPPIWRLMCSMWF
jgi:hypothetical protein